MSGQGWSDDTDWKARVRAQEPRRHLGWLIGGYALGLLATIGVLAAVTHPTLNLLDPLETKGQSPLKPSANGLENIDPEQVAEVQREFEICSARIRAADTAPALPGAPEFEARRAQLLLRAKAEPVIWSDVPRRTVLESPSMTAHQARLGTHEAPLAAAQLIRQLQDFPEHLRGLFLREGYVYADESNLARELASRLKLELLFTEPELTIERGSARFKLVRRKGTYFFDSGESAGEPAQLLLFDRVWAGNAEPGRQLQVDVREAARRFGMDQLVPVKLTERHLRAKVRYGSSWTEALFERVGADLTLDCVLAPASRFSELGRARDEAFRRSRVVAALSRAMVAQVRAGLPFDEPKTERGQQDGELRLRWENAYFAGRSRFHFNGDDYSVFDQAGQPLTPQVCIDFVTETLERAAGMRFAERGARPEKLRGTLDFDQLLEGRRRQESALRQFAKDHPESFESLDYPEDEWVRYEDTGDFFLNLEARHSELQPGDIAIIRGRAAWDRYEEIHTHTFFVYETDPVTAVPLLLAGNSGKPRIVTWDQEMRRAPKRSLRHRLRPKMDWLYDHVVLEEPSPGHRHAAPLSVWSDKLAG